MNIAFTDIGNKMRSYPSCSNETLYLFSPSSYILLSSLNIYLNIYFYFTTVQKVVPSGCVIVTYVKNSVMGKGKGNGSYIALSYDTCHPKLFTESSEGSSFTPFLLVVAATTTEATQG